MAAKKKPAGDEGSEFAEFMADISQEIAQRVESLTPAENRIKNEKKAAAPDPGVILDWGEVADRIIEEMR